MDGGVRSLAQIHVVLVFNKACPVTFHLHCPCSAEMFIPKTQSWTFHVPSDECDSVGSPLGSLITIWPVNLTLKLLLHNFHSVTQDDKNLYAARSQAPSCKMSLPRDRIHFSPTTNA